jgi:hypothetical protein
MRFFSFSAGCELRCPLVAEVYDAQRHSMDTRASRMLRFGRRESGTR